MFTVAVPLQCRCSISPFIFSRVETRKNCCRFHLYIFMSFNFCWFGVKYNHKIVPNTKLPLKFPLKHPSPSWRLAPPGGYHSILKGFSTRYICQGSSSENTSRRPPEFRQPETTSVGSSVYSELLLDIWAPLPVSKAESSRTPEETHFGCLSLWSFGSWHGARVAM